MKTLILFIFIVFLTLGTRSQTVPDSIFVFTFDMLTASRDSVADLNKQIINYDTIVNSQKRVIIRDSIININNDTMIEKLKRDMIPPTPPLIAWEGLFAGISASFPFDSSIIHNSFLTGLNYALELTGGVLIADKWLVQGSFAIPFKSTVFIKAYIGYRIF